MPESAPVSSTFWAMAFWAEPLQVVVDRQPGVAAPNCRGDLLGTGGDDPAVRGLLVGGLPRLSLQLLVQQQLEAAAARSVSAHPAHE